MLSKSLTERTAQGSAGNTGVSSGGSQPHLAWPSRGTPGHLHGSGHRPELQDREVPGSCARGGGCDKEQGVQGSPAPPGPAVCPALRIFSWDAEQEP